MSDIKNDMRKLDEIMRNQGKNQQKNNNEIIEVESTQSSDSNLDSFKKDLAVNNVVPKNLNLINIFKANNLTAKKELEALEVALDTKIKILKNQANAIEENSKTYWTTQTANFSETLKAFATKNMQIIEKNRANDKMEIITQLCVDFAKRMTEIMNKEDIPESAMVMLLTKAEEIRDRAIQRIDNDVIAGKYNLSSPS